MAKRRPKTSANDVPLPIKIEAPDKPTTTGGLEADKPKKATRKKKDYGRIKLPDMGKRKLISRIERDEDDHSIVTLNNTLSLLIPEHRGWRVKDAQSLNMLAEYGYAALDKDELDVAYIRLHVELEPTEDGFFKLTACAFAEAEKQAKHMINVLCGRWAISDPDAKKRIERDACFPYTSVEQGVARIGHWLTNQVEMYVSTVKENRIEELCNPPEGMRQWSQRDNQVLSRLYRSDANWEAMGEDKD